MCVCGRSEDEEHDEKREGDDRKSRDEDPAEIRSQPSHSADGVLRSNSGDFLAVGKDGRNSRKGSSRLHLLRVSDLRLLRQEESSEAGNVPLHCLRTPSERGHCRHNERVEEGSD